LIAFSAGYDAVIQLAEPVLTQMLQQDYPPLLLPGAFREISSDSPPSWFGVNVPAQAQRSKVKINLPTPTPDGGQIVLVEKTADLKKGVVGLNNIALDLYIFNNTSSDVSVLTTASIGGVVFTATVPKIIQPTQVQRSHINLIRIPDGTHPIQVRVFDLSGRAIESTVVGELIVIPPYSVSPETEAVSVPLNLVKNIRQMIYENTPEEGDLDTQGWREVYSDSYHASTVTRINPLSVDIDSSTSTKVTLTANLQVEMRILFKWQTFHMTESGILDAALQHYLGQPPSPEVPKQLPTGEIVWEAMFMPQKDILESGWLIGSDEILLFDHKAGGRLKVEVPINTSVDSATQIVNLMIDLGQAITTFETSDVYAQEVFKAIQSEITQTLKKYGLRRLAPPISLLGEMPPNTYVQELSIQQIDIKPLPANASNLRSCFALGFILTGSSTTPGNLQNFINADDFAVVISGKVMQAIAGFRWRIGSYPRELLNEPIEEIYTEKDTKIPILIYSRLVQRDIVDTSGAVLAKIRLAGTYTYGTTIGVYTYLMRNETKDDKTYSEDHLLLGGPASFEIMQVLRKDNAQPAPAEVQKVYKVPPQLQNVQIEWPYILSWLGPPPPFPDPTQEQHIQAMRQGVTSHFSRPFADFHAIALTVRQTNGNENLLLNRGKIKLLL
jgi:hypothetical protein